VIQRNYNHLSHMKTRDGRRLPSLLGAGPLAFAVIFATVILPADGQPTNTVIATVQLPSSLPFGIGVTPDNLYVYVIGNGANALFRLDTKTNAFENKSIGLGGNPQFLAFLSAGADVYVTNAITPFDGTDAVPGTVSLISDGEKANPHLKETITGMGKFAGPIAINPKGTQAWVGDYYEACCTVVDLKKNKAEPLPVQTGSGPTSVAFTPNGKCAYVTNYLDNTIVKINTATQLIVGDPVAVGKGPRNVVITPDGEKAYVTNQDGTVSVIDVATNQVVTTVSVAASDPGYYQGSALTPDGLYLYVGNQGAETVEMISTKIDKVVGNPVTVGSVPGIIAIAPNGKRAYVTNLYDATVSVIEITGG